MGITTDSMITTLETQRAAAERRRDHAHRQASAIVNAVRSQGRPDLTPGEFGAVDRLAGERDRAARDLEALDVRIAEVRAARADDLEYTTRQSQLYPTGVQLPGRARTASMSVGRNERTYREDTDRRGSGFLRDVGQAFLYGPGCSASQRLNRHMSEEEAERGGGLMERASGTGNLAGLVVPQYLTDMYAPAARAMRPFADVCNHHDLPPDGMTVNLPLLTTPSTVALQASENSGVSSSSPGTTLLTENVQTAAGTTTISRQAIDRGTGVDQVVMQDLFNACATDLDSTLVNQATTGLSALATAVTYTSAGPTVPEFWPYMFQAGSRLERALLQVGQWSHIVMGISRWNWLTAALSSQFPFAGSAVQTTPPSPPPDGHQGVVSITNEYGPAVRGRLANGKLVCVDANIPTNLGASTNQDEVYAVAASECHLWEDPDAPVFIRAEQPAAASLGVMFVVFEYFAYSLRRFSGIPIKISGTGLVVPSGY